MSPAAEEFTPQAELLGQMEELSQRDAFADNIRYGARVTAVRTVDAEGQDNEREPFYTRRKGCPPPPTLPVESL